MVKCVDDLPDRIRSKIKVDSNGCWLWTAATGDGYGMLSWKGDYNSRYAHRIVYELLVGPIPKGLEIDHLCRVRHCVKPDHLEVVTHKENMQRGDAGKIWRDKTHCPYGHPYNEENTRWYDNCRYCRACDRDRKRAQADVSRQIIKRKGSI